VSFKQNVNIIEITHPEIRIIRDFLTLVLCEDCNMILADRVKDKEKITIPFKQTHIKIINQIIEHAYCPERGSLADQITENSYLSICDAHYILFKKKEYDKI
tara:strand:+ start:16640 stop:16945 length:306 start_codon:yes stop_codon:yes gene_type:complete